LERDRLKMIYAPLSLSSLNIEVKEESEGTYLIGRNL
jgi:hypothetical protein